MTDVFSTNWWLAGTICVVGVCLAICLDQVVIHRSLAARGLLPQRFDHAPALYGLSILGFAASAAALWFSGQHLWLFAMLGLGLSVPLGSTLLRLLAFSGRDYSPFAGSFQAGFILNLILLVSTSWMLSGGE